MIFGWFVKKLNGKDILADGSIVKELVVVENELKMVSMRYDCLKDRRAIDELDDQCEDEDSSVEKIC